MKNKILGLVLLPLLYVRWAFLLVFPICIYLGITDETTLYNLIIFGFICWIIWGLFFVFIFGNCEAMIPITKWLHKICKVEYINKEQWTNDMMHSHSIWVHPTIEINGKEHKFSFASMGGNIYDVNANLRRSILFIYLFDGGKKN